MTPVHRDAVRFSGNLGPGALFVPGQHLRRVEATIWCWRAGGLERWSVSRKSEAAALLPVLAARPLPFGFESATQLVAFLLGPHSVLPTPRGLVVSDRAGVDIYLVTEGWSRPLVGEPGWAYASTPALLGDAILTARWPTASTGTGDALAEVLWVPLGGGPARSVVSFPFGDFVHQVAIDGDGTHAVVTEMGMYVEGGDLRSARLRGSRVAVVDLAQGTATVIAAPHAAPAHVEVDPEGRVWLSCHNMGLFEGSNVLFGAGALMRGLLSAGGIQFDATYTHPAFHRITTHQTLRWRGRPAVAATVFPNAVEIIDADSLACLDRVEVYPAPRLAPGVQRCDADRASPFSLVAQGDDKLILNAARTFYRLRPGEPVVASHYNEDLAQHVGGHMAWSGAAWA